MGIWNSDYPWPGLDKEALERAKAISALSPSEVNCLLSMESAILRERSIEKCKQKILKGDPTAHRWVEDDIWRIASARAVSQVAQAVEKLYG